MRAQITLYGDDADRFEDIRDDVEEQRDGSTPARSEVVRLMMDQFDADDV